MVRGHTFSKNRRLVLLFVAATTLTSSGCLTALGLNRSSLSPRMATANQSSDSTVRSQDSRLTGFGWTGPSDTVAAPAAHVGPATSMASANLPTSGYTDYGTPTVQHHARLLPPEFGSSTAEMTEAGGAASVLQAPSGSSLFIQPASPASPGVNQQAAIPLLPKAQESTPNAVPDRVSQPASAFGSLGFNAEQVRTFLNNQSRNAMSEGQLLKDRVTQWQMFSSTSPTEASDGVETPPGNLPGAAGSQTVVQPTESGNTESGPDGTPVAPVSTTLESEPSILDRLKGIYEPGTESNARRLWKRPFQKNPWYVFRERQEAAETAPEPQPPVETAELPAESRNSAAEIHPLLTQLIAATEKELQAWPRQLNGSPDQIARYQRRQQDLRLLYLMADQPGGAIQAVEELPKGEQEFWQELMLGLAQYRTDDAEMANEQRLTSAANQIQSAVRHLAPLSSLQIRRFDICSRIHSFGRIESFPTNDFDPGQPILLYAEIENFGTEITAAGRHRTRFDAQLQIFEDGNDKPRESVDLSNITDEATSERTDYYQSFELNLPSHFKTGQYRIRLRLRDRITGKLAEAHVAFQVR
ncbi:MAG: hypothetical protein R3C59_19885 [Planctomycetaceae bacterium]